MRTALRPAPSAYPAHCPAPYRGNPSPRLRTPAHRHRPRGRHKSPVLRPGCPAVQRQPLLRVAAQPGPPGIRCTILKLRRAQVLHQHRRGPGRFQAAACRVRAEIHQPIQHGKLLGPAACVPGARFGRYRLHRGRRSGTAGAAHPASRAAPAKRIANLRIPNAPNPTLYYSQQVWRVSCLQQSPQLWRRI